MTTGNLRRKRFQRGDDTSRIETKPLGSQLPQDEEEDLETYIRIFVENGLELEDELMVNHEAIAAAKRESAADFHRKRRVAQ